MKKIIIAVFSVFLLLICSRANAQVVTIAGPVSCLTPLTDVFYTGTQNLSTAGCTKHRWTITGGVFIVGGVPSTCPDLYIAERDCMDASLSCVLTGFTPMVTSTVAVRWNAGISTGTLTLLATEGLTEMFTSISVTVANITSVSQTSFNCTSATYSAMANCPGTFVWSRRNSDGTFSVVGTGPTLTDSPNFDNVTYRVDLVNSAGIIVRTLTKTFPGMRPQTLSGPSIMGPNQAATFELQEPALTANWSVWNSCSSIPFSTVRYADVKNTNCNPGTYFSVNVSGTWTCGTFSANKWVSVAYGKSPSNTENEVTNEGVESSAVEDRSNIALTSVLPFEVKVFPVPSRNGRISGSVEGQFEVAKLRIMDITGREVFATDISSNAFDLDVPQLTSGTYIIQVNSSNGSATRKITMLD